MIVDHAGQITADSWACEYDIRYDIIHIYTYIYICIYICIHMKSKKNGGTPNHPSRGWPYFLSIFLHTWCHLRILHYPPRNSCCCTAELVGPAESPGAPRRFFLAIIVATQRGHWGLECLYSQRFLGRNLKIWYFELGCLDVLAGQWASGVVFFVSFERSYGVFVGFKLLQAMGVECLQYFFVSISMGYNPDIGVLLITLKNWEVDPEASLTLHQQILGV